MLQKMREQTQSLAFKVLVGILVFVMAIFGFGAFNLFVTGEPEVASVNGEGITQNELSVATERERQRIAAQMGEDFDPSLIDPVRLQANVLEQLIARRVLWQAADDLGVGISRAQVDEFLVSTPAFQIDGQFNRDVYRQAVRSMGYTPQGFMTETSRMLGLQQLQSSVAGSSFLTGRALNLHAGLLGQRRDIAYLPFQTDRYRDEVTVTDEDVRLRYDENRQMYMTEESVDAAYVMLTLQHVMDDPSIAVTEEEVRGAYEAERAAAPAEEERRSRHILLEAGDTRSAEDAIATLNEIKARVESGESFAEIATEVSEDSGSAAQGGDLGFAGRGIFDPAFEEALFALEEPGDVSNPVQTEFGHHLIQLEEIRTNEYPSFEESRDGIEQRLRRQAAQELFSSRLQELDNLAFENPNGLAAIEQAMGLEIQTAEGVTRMQGPPPFDDPELRGRLFTRDVLDNGFNSAATEIGENRAVVMRVNERHEPEQIPFEEVAGDIRNEIETERARLLAIQAFEDARARVQAGESTSTVAADHGANWQTFELVRRNAPDVPRDVLDVAFTLPRPSENGKSVGDSQLPGGTALVTVTRVQDGRVDALTQAELNGMRAFLADRASRLEFAAMFETARAEASVSRADEG